jgi:hypothetical protein
MAATKKTSSTPSPLAGIVDELGDLEVWAAPLAPKLARLELLKKSVRAHFDASPAAESQTADGTRFVCLLGPRASEATVDVTALARSIGTKATFRIVRCTLKALEAFPGLAVTVVTRALTGTRSLKTFEKGTP